MTLKTTIIAAGALIAAGAAAVPQAQAASANFSLHLATPHATIHFMPGHRGPRWQRHTLSPREIRFRLHRAGFRHIRSLNRRGPVYVARAVTYRGHIYAVRVSARNGRILAQQPLGRVGHHRRGHRGWRY